MAEEKVEQVLHIVIRPCLEHLPPIDKVVNWLKNYMPLAKYIISKEKGNSDGHEQYNHYDMAVLTNSNPPKRCDVVKKSIRNCFKLDEQDMRNVRVLELKPPRDIRQQIGYALKENRGHETNFDDEYLDLCKDYYDENPMDDTQVKTWDTNQIVDKFVEYIHNISISNKFNEELINRYWSQFSKESFEKRKFRYCAWSKINIKQLSKLLINSGESTEEILNGEEAEAFSDVMDRAWTKIRKEKEEKVNLG